MAKFSVEYSRTVRVKAYETLRYSFLMEADDKDQDPDDLRDWLRNRVKRWIDEDLAELKTERSKPT